ncbi:MAG TPA: ABC transporter permease [Jiangellaceae bacterium]|nr:ABC transporter permease [Jiangellaceae bacterium]
MTAFTGTWRLVRLALRRDRIQLPIWIGGLTLLTWSLVPSIIGFYPTERERVEFAISSANSPVVLMTNGLVSGTSIGAIVAAQGLLTLAIGAAFMSTLAVVRHTRQNEETGRAELVGAGIVGRHASLTAALVVVVGANVVLGLLTTLVLIGNDLPATGSFAMGAGVGATGVAFGAIAAVLAQVFEGARATNGMAAGAIGIAFVLRAAGDAMGQVVDGGIRVESLWLSWLSPIGWAAQLRPYDYDNFWILGIFAAAFVGLVGLAFELTQHRDVGAGMRATRPGPAYAPQGLLSPLGLAWRLQRAVLVGWIIAMAVLGASYGGVGNEIEDFVTDSQTTEDIFADFGSAGASLTDNYFAAILAMLGIMAAGYTVQALLRMRSEEVGGTAESVLATAVSRPRWMASHIAIAVVGTAVILAAAGVGAGLTYGLIIGDAGEQMARMMQAAVVQVPAALVLAGFVIAVFGLLPRIAVALAWGVFTLFLVVSFLGPTLGLSQWVLNLSPFSHLPAAPVEDVSALPLALLLAVAASLAALGVAAFRRRDLALS